MQVAKHKLKIKKLLTNIGSYNKKYDLLIQILAENLYLRDSLKEEYKKNKDIFVKNEEGNYIESPIIKMLNDNTRYILQLLTLLGLTPLSEAIIKGTIDKKEVKELFNEFIEEYEEGNEEE